MTHRRAGRATAAALAVAIAVTVTGCGAYVSRAILPRPVDRERLVGVRVQRDVSFTTDDGARLSADVFRPRIAGKTPAILVRLPYTRTFTVGLGTDAVGRYWAQRGYTAVIQATRGRHRSTGDHTPLIHEREDGLATLRWLAAQPWFDGRLGMWGGSAFGHTQWAVADQTAPGASAFIIQIASTDLREMFHPGGAFSLESALFWALRSRDPRDRVPTPAEIDRGANGFPLIDADNRAVGHNVPVFDDWAARVDRDDYWQRVDGVDRASTLAAPALLMAGWSDPFLPSQIRDFQTIRRHADPRVAEGTRLVIGPWTHAGEIVLPSGARVERYRRASLAPTLAWFDHHLRGRPSSGVAAPIRLYVMGDDRWRDEQEWPLARTRFTAYYLRSAGRANTALGDGRLELAPPAGDEPPDTFTYDPRSPVPSRGGAMLGPRAGLMRQDDVERRADVLVYSSEPLASDLELTGPVTAEIAVSTTAVSTDVTAKLVDVFPDGRAYNVTDGIRRFASPDPSPDRVHDVVIELWPTSQVFRRGHRLRLDVSSSNFPRYDRNPNTGRVVATDVAPVAATQRVWHRPGAVSRVVVPVVPR